ncbi:rRNA pseudouridine synthase [Candidatus Woesearchaeota archaeon]|nr:rRNA pseudouridine synthase [Candidatus Woesearchaeota archaeon]
MLQRVQKIIAGAGLCSRRKAEELIKQGKVQVNGKVITIGSSADPFRDAILVEGKRLTQPQKMYLAFNKPPDCLTTLHDPKGRKTILAYLKLKERVIPVGRLDFKTQGLLFLTNDGEFANHVMHPRYEVEKTYMVFLDRPFIKQDVDKVKKGIDLGDIKTKPARMRYASPNQDVIDLSIHEGQNRVVRKMMSHLGYKVKRLIRTKIGNVELGSIPSGQYRKLSYQEVQQFMK